MVALTPRERMLREVTESAWSRDVEKLARSLGFSGYHTHRSERSPAGWPDWAFWKPGRFLLAELKTETGRLSPKQEEVIAGLLAAGVEVYVWRPRDLEAAAAVLNRRPAILL